MIENLRDRGMKKWQGLMLPEHNIEIKHWLDEENYVVRPELNEWDLQAIQHEIEVACKRKCQTHIKSWKEGRIIHRRGIIAIDLKSDCILLDDPFGLDKLPISDIVDVQCVE